MKTHKGTQNTKLISCIGVKEEKIGTYNYINIDSPSCLKCICISRISLLCHWNHRFIGGEDYKRQRLNNLKQKITKKKIKIK